jgi:hypothetical protein
MHTRHRWAALLRIALLLLTGLLVLIPLQVTAAPARQAADADWLIMVYNAADDNILEEDMLIDLQEMELIGSTDRVTIVVQTDRYAGGYAGMGDWTTSKRFLITQDNDMTRFGSTEIADLGEVNMAAGATLRDFIDWAVTSYPAQKRMLILSDHGIGWPGGMSDPDPGPRPAVTDDVILAEFFGDNLWLSELDQTLTQARADLGLDAFDVIGFDACLMSQLEVYTALAPHALYAVASQEVEPGVGWAYAGFLGRLVDDPTMDGAELAAAIVDTYIVDDIRLEDPNFVGNLTREQAAEVLLPDTTLAAVDLRQIAALNLALDDFIAVMATIDQSVVAKARTYAQSFESVFGDEYPSPYIDLGHFSRLVLSGDADPALQAAGEALDAARDAALVAEKHGDARPGSTGIAIYFPVRDIYAIADNLGYGDVAGRFTDATQWDEFLAFHNGDAARPPARPAAPLATALTELLPELDADYIQVLVNEINAMIDAGMAADDIAASLVDDYELPEEVVAVLFDGGLLGPPAAAAPQPGVDQRKPLEVGPITLSAEVAYPDVPVTIEATVRGDRVGYVYTFIGRFLPEEDVLIIEDQDYYFAEEEADLDGVTYPVWPEGEFTVAFDWEPVVYAISDGETAIRTLFAPASYGEEPTYTTEGIYRFADGSPDRYARLFFRNGELERIFGFVGSAGGGVAAAAGIGAPRQINPQPGDQFTVLAQGFNLAEDAEDENYRAELGTVTYGVDGFYIEATPAPSGNYVVGVIAEDLDGNQVESYEGLFVVGEDEVTAEGFVPLVNEELGFALLYPATWTPDPEVDPATGVTLSSEDGSALMTVAVWSYPDVADPNEANALAVDDLLAELAADESLTDVTPVDEPVDYLLGSFDALLRDFSFEVDGEPYMGEIVAATPTPGLTYFVLFTAPAADGEVLLYDLDAVLYSFDILLSGIDRSVAGAPQPDFADVWFEDDYSDPTSGLYDDEEAADWGLGYYDPAVEQYVFEMNPGYGAIYDYYYDLALPDSFMLEATAESYGTADTGFGLIFQVQEDESFYAFRVSGDGYFLVEKADAESLEPLIDWTPADGLLLDEGAVNTLAVVGEAGVYRLFINGEQVGEFADASYAEGSAGYIVENYDAAEPAAFVFDNLVIGEPTE